MGVGRAGRAGTLASARETHVPGPHALRVFAPEPAARERRMRGDADPYRAIDRQVDPKHFVIFLEERGNTPSQVRLRRRFLRFCGIRRGWRVLEVGAGTGVLTRDVATMVGPRGHVIGVDPSRVLVSAGRRLARAHGVDGHVAFRVGDGSRLGMAADQFDCALAVTVLLHVRDGRAIVRELTRVTKPGGVVGLQDQDLGALVLDHPDRALTRRILDGVAARTVVDPWSGRALRGRLVEAGLERVRLVTDVFQDTTYTPFTRSMLGRRADNAVRFGITSARAAAGWLETLERLARAGRFVMTLNFYGAAGVKPGATT